VPEADEKPQNNIRDAALFLLSVGQDRAAEVLRLMTPKQVQEISNAMNSLGAVTPGMVNDVLSQFINTMSSMTALGLDAGDYIRNAMVAALGVEKASSILDRSLLDDTEGLVQLKWMDPRMVADLIRNEHPQIITIILSLLDYDLAAKTLSYMNTRMQADVIMRLATLQNVQPTALKELDQIMLRTLDGASTKSSDLGGVDSAANILNMMETAVETSIIEKITELDSGLSQKLQDKMFLFDDLAAMDDRSMQTLLREVNSDQLLLALRAAGDEIKEMVLRNLSRRAAEMLREDMENAPPARLADVEGAQKDILAIARRMSDNGEIMLGGSGDMV
jgi:flagellar motor switch protein FliG